MQTMGPRLSHSQAKHIRISQWAHLTSSVNQTCHIWLFLFVLRNRRIIRKWKMVPKVKSGQKVNSVTTIAKTLFSTQFAEYGRTSGAGAQTVVRCATKLWVPNTNKIWRLSRCAILGIYELAWVRHCHTLHSGPSLQSMASLDKILGAPTVPHLRCGCSEAVKKIVRCATTL